MAEKNLAAAKKIKKWLETAKELENIIIAIQITRLTSIKSLCRDETDAQKFALHFAKRVQQKMSEMPCPEHFLPEEWNLHKQVVAQAVVEMENYLQEPSSQTLLNLDKILREIDKFQGNDYRRVHWTTVHFVRSGYLLKIQYAVNCYCKPDYPFWAYKLAREYAEKYDSYYGGGLTPKSKPMLLEIAEFWCQHYFEQSLKEKFPQLVD